MALDFPASPSVGTTHPGPGGVLWQYDGQKWANGQTSVGSGVSSWNARTGAVTQTGVDVTTALTYTPYDSTNPAGYQTAAQVTTAVAPALNNVGRNLIHNSMFNVAQRGAGPWTASGYTTDRWAIAAATDALSFSIIAQSDAGRGQVGDESCRNVMAMGVTGNAAAGAYTAFRQSIEGLARVGGKTVTVSFYAAGSASTLKLGLNILQDFGTGGAPSPQTWVQATGTSVTLSTSWARYSATFTMPSTSGKTFGTAGNDSAGLWFWLSSGTTSNTTSGNVSVQSGSFYLWGVQLEIGSVATPLDKPDPQVELANCQRFYVSGSWVVAGYNSAGATTNMVMHALPVVPRAVPTIAISGAPTLTNCSAPSLAMWQTWQFVASATTTALGSYQAYGNFTASADL